MLTKERGKQIKKKEGERGQVIKWTLMPLQTHMSGFFKVNSEGNNGG